MKIEIQTVNGGRFVQMLMKFNDSHAFGSIQFTSEQYEQFKKLLGSGAVNATQNGIDFRLVETNF